MQMVSATKMRKAQNQALGGRSYWEILQTVLAQLESGKLPNHFLLQENSSEKVGVILMTSDKGLCGALNTNVIRQITNDKLQVTSLDNVLFYTVGKKGRDFIVRSGKNLEADFENPEKVHETQARTIRHIIVQDFKEAKIGKLYLLYPHFGSTLRQEPKLVKLLPIETSLLVNSLNREASEKEKREASSEKSNPEFLFEPDLPALLNFALLHLLDISIYQSLLETKASEHSARMMAMQNATQNASDLVDDLTLTYNQLRQENITRELLEITSAAAALE